MTGNRVAFTWIRSRRRPEYKFGAVRLEPIADQAWAENYVQQEYSTLKGTLSKAGSKTPACA